MAQFLARTAIFHGCPAELLQKLAPHIEQETVPPGATMMAPGRPPSGLSFLTSGHAALQVVEGPSGARLAIEDVAPGDCYSEVGLLLGAATPLAVGALEECHTAHILSGHLDKIIQVYPALVLALSKRVAARFVKLSLLRAAQHEGELAGTSLPTTAHAALSLSAQQRDPNLIPFVQAANFAPNPKVLEMIPSRMVQEHRVLPLELRDRTLVVGMVNPLSIAAKEELRKILHSVDPEIVAISQEDFSSSIVRLKLDAREPASSKGVVSRALRPRYYAELKKEAEKGLQIIGDDASVLLDQLLLEGLEKGASEIAIEPEATALRVRYRIQGLSEERREAIAPTFASPVLARIKVLSELDITDRRTPQDGRIVAQLGKRELNIRVSTLPTARGERAVLRLLDPSDVMRPLEQIVLDSRALALVQGALSIPQGAFLVSGPSGSGKTSTLYALMHQRKMHKSSVDIVTAEDPIEFLLPGVTQTPVNAKAGLGYPQVIRAMLRSHPEVIVIGELTDPDTAHIMGEASLTGTQVLTTIHGNNAASVLQRLVQFRLDPVMIGQALSIILSQKLVRRLCSSCAREEEVAPELLRSLRMRDLIPKAGASKLPRAVGCDACGGSGFFGRIPVVEVFCFDPETRMMLGSGESFTKVLEAAESNGNYLSFTQSARMLMARRVLTPADALAVAG